MSAEQYWHGNDFEHFQAECIADQQFFDDEERVARGPIACEADWQTKEWLILAAMAEAKGLTLFRGTCHHAEYFNKGQGPTQPALCTRCMLKGLAQ